VLAGPAAACINDSELKTHEREFRSQYGTPSQPIQAVPDSTGSTSTHPTTTLVGVAGLILLIGGIGIAWRGSANRG